MSDTPSDLGVRLEWLDLLPRPGPSKALSAALAAVDAAQAAGPDADPNALADALLATSEPSIIVAALLAWTTLDDVEWSVEIVARTIQALSRSRRMRHLQSIIFCWMDDFLATALHQQAHRLALLFGALVETSVVSLHDLCRHLTARGLSHRTTAEDPAFRLRYFLAQIPMPPGDQALGQQRDRLVGMPRSNGLVSEATAWVQSGVSSGDFNLAMFDALPAEDQRCVLRTLVDCGAVIPDDAIRRLAWLFERARYWSGLRQVRRSPRPQAAHG